MQCKNRLVDDMRCKNRSRDDMQCKNRSRVQGIETGTSGFGFMFKSASAGEEVRGLLADHPGIR